MLMVNWRQVQSIKRNRYLKVLLLILILFALHLSGEWIETLINHEVIPKHGRMMDLFLIGIVLIYILLMATPFMPGIEVGLGLMMLFGSKGAVLVYLSTLAALSISYLAGRLISPKLVCRFLHWLHLYQARSLVLQLEPLGRLERLQLLQEKLPDKLALFLVNHRYLTIAAALNLPGNALIGGGGGIGLVVGMSKIIPYWGYVTLLAVAVAPVPLWFYFNGG
ncbi:hypothetical protein [Sedimenticola sp.]|uniref:hypothetical protein n=1 Tax=Sedimenticola sp. TaxID=1940285 RepID=UPI003D140E69